jgi:hypothetical protein
LPSFTATTIRVPSPSVWSASAAIARRKAKEPTAAGRQRYVALDSWSSVRVRQAVQTPATRRWSSTLAPGCLGTTRAENTTAAPLYAHEGALNRRLGRTVTDVSAVAASQVASPAYSTLYVVFQSGEGVHEAVPPASAVTVRTTVNAVSPARMRLTVSVEAGTSMPAVRVTAFPAVHTTGDALSDSVGAAACAASAATGSAVAARAITTIDTSDLAHPAPMNSPVRCISSCSSLRTAAHGARRRGQ